MGFPVYVADKDQIKELQADNRGRVNLGIDHANREVTVAIIDTGDPDPLHDLDGGPDTDGTDDEDDEQESENIEHLK